MLTLNHDCVNTTMSDPGDFDNTSLALDGNDKYIPRGKLQIIVFVLAVLLIPLFCLLGSVGNILSLRVLFHQRMRNQTNYMLGALCISDTLFLIHCLIFTGINVYKKTNPVAGEALRARVYPAFGAYGSVVTARITSCLITLICIERYVAVFYPMQAKLVCSKKNTVIAIIVIYVLTILAFIPFGLKYEAVEVNMRDNSTHVVLNKSSFYLNSVRFFSGYGTFLNIVYRFLPLAVIPVLNVRMIRAVHQTWKLRREMSGHKEQPGQKGAPRHISDQHRITIMLVTVTFVFFFSILPGAINSIVTHIMPSYSRLGDARNLYLCVSSVTFLLETINSSINFIIYMAMSRKFRLLYKEIFCCGHGKYYNKISVSSVKDRFKWVSNRKSSSSEHDGKTSFRRTVSDCGPVRGKPATRQPLYDCVHSEGFEGADVDNNTKHAPWTADSKCCNNGNHQSPIEDDSSMKSNHVSNGLCSLCRCPRGSMKASNGQVPAKRSNKTKKHTGSQEDSKRHRAYKNDFLNFSDGLSDKALPSYQARLAMNTIYNIDQEMPLISENSCSADGRELKKSDL